MPTIEDYKAYLVRSDYGLMFLLAATGLCVAITLVLCRRWPAFRRISSAIAPTVVPAALLTANPGLALPAALLGALSLKPPRLRVRLGVKPVLLFALGLRVLRMGDGLWYDEAFTQRLTTLNLSQLPAAILADVHPPTYYLLTWLWTRLAGNSALALRLPSLVWGMLAILLLYRLVKRLGLGQKVAVTAALLMAVTPSAIYYATEARNYAMLTCAVFGAIICILEDRPRLFILCAAATAWLHNLGLTYAVVLCLGALAYRWFGAATSLKSMFLRHPNQWLTARTVPSIVQGMNARRRRWLMSAVAAGLLSLVWLPLILHQVGAVNDGFWIDFDSATPLWSSVFNLLYLQRDYILPIMLPYVGLLLLGFYQSRRWLLRTPAGRLLALLLIGAPGLTILVSVTWAPIYIPRLFLPLNLLTLIPVAYALHHYRRAVAATAAPVFLASLLVFQSNAALNKPDYAGMVAQGCAGATAMYYTALDTAITIAPVWPGKSLVWGEGQDRGMTFKADQMPLFNFQDGDITQFAGERVCLVYIYTPRTLQPERDYVRTLLARYPNYTGIIFFVHDELQVQIYQFSVKG